MVVTWGSYPLVAVALNTLFLASLRLCVIVLTFAK